MADDVPQALASLKDALASLSNEQASDAETVESSDSFNDNDEEEVSIGLDKRAGPLISLLEAAIEAKENVLWND